MTARTPTHEVVITIGKLDRLYNTRYGNPRWHIVSTDLRVWPTQPDANFVHMMENSEFRGVPVVLTVNNRGHVTRIRVATEEDIRIHGQQGR